MSGPAPVSGPATVSVEGERARPAAHPLVAIDTATRRACIAIGDGVGAPLAVRSWHAGYRHGEELLASLDDLLRDSGVGLGDLGGVVAGTGPGAFTGLRVGLATAKGLAYGLRIPIVGVPSTEGLAAASAEARDGRDDPLDLAVLLPAGPHDRYLARYLLPGGQDPAPAGTLAGGPELVPGGEPIGPRVAGAVLVAIDLPQGPGISGEAVAAGTRAQERLGVALLRLGRVALQAGRAVDVAELVPGYVTLPRGITEQVGTIEWSRDLR